MSETASYKLAYQAWTVPFFLTLCQKHLAKRLTNGASVLEKRSSWPANEPCSDCNHERKPR